eukprot:g37525.t1
MNVTDVDTTMSLPLEDKSEILPRGFWHKRRAPVRYTLLILDAKSDKPDQVLKHPRRLSKKKDQSMSSDSEGGRCLGAVGVVLGLVHQDVLEGMVPAEGGNGRGGEYVSGGGISLEVVKTGADDLLDVDAGGMV